MKSVVIGGTSPIGSKTVAIQSSQETQGIESSAVQFFVQPRYSPLSRGFCASNGWPAVVVQAFKDFSQGVAPSTPHHSSVNDPGTDSRSNSSM